MTASGSPDILIVGSGPSAVQAAQTLIESGRTVWMLDVGREPEAPEIAHPVPDTSFLRVRREDSEQYRYFLGPRLEGISFGKIQAGSNLPASRRFVVEGVEKCTPIESKHFQPVESLALGGLGNAWGLGAFTMSDSELRQMGLPLEGIKKSYGIIARRIGISAASDDTASQFSGALESGATLPPLEIDEAATHLYQTYEKKRETLAKRGFRLGKPPLALLSQDWKGRRGTRYQDLDFWHDPGETAYRPAITLRWLKEQPGFRYQSNSLVLSFREGDFGVEVIYRDLSTGEERVARAAKLVLAAGVFGTARIVLRSMPTPGELPFLCNPYFYVLCLQPSLAGRELADRRHSMGQLALSYDPGGDGSFVPIASLVSYRSLLLFRLIKEAPLAYREARAVMQFLQTGFMIAGIHHPDAPRDQSRRALSLDGDRLRIEFSESNEERETVRTNQKAMLGALRSLRCYPIRSVNPGPGASIHYGGTLPFGDQRSQPVMTSVSSGEGRLNGTKYVYVADGSPFKMLPAKGITLTLMAYADWVARRIASM